MYRILIFAFFALFAASLGFSQTPVAGFNLANYGVRIEPDKRLIAVMAALEMARTGGDAGEPKKLINTPLSAKGEKFRERLLKDNEGLPDDLRQRISTFVSQYKKLHPRSSDAELVAPFISMAYSLTPAPELLDPTVTTDLPGNLLDVLDFAPLVRDFYRRSTLAGHMDEYMRLYRDESEGVLRNSTRDMVTDLLDYMHTQPQLFVQEKVKVETQKGKNKSAALQKTEVRTRERKFFVVPEMLAPQGSVNFVNIRDEYFVITPPDKDLSYSDVRRAFLQFVIDPLVLKNSREIYVIRDWAKPILDERRKSDPTMTPDVYLAITRSLVAAVDTTQTQASKYRIATNQARERITQLKTEAEKKAISDELANYKKILADDALIQLADDYEKGAILAFYFADQLKGIEDSGFDLGASLREMIASFDAAKEKARLDTIYTLKKNAVAARAERKNKPDLVAITVENPVTKRLQEITAIVDKKDYAKATGELKDLQAKNPEEARISYNIGRVASLWAESMNNDPDEQAKKLREAHAAYSSVIGSGTTDRALLSLTYVALARIYEFFSQPATAIKLYDKAIELDDVAGGAYSAALTAKQRLIKQ